MLLILIPLFLGVNVPLNDTTIETWSNGPEFTFTGKMDYNVFADVNLKPFDYDLNAMITCTLKCRPKAVDKLLCDLYNVTDHSMGQGGSIMTIPDTKFVVRYNESGIESLMFEEPQPLKILNMIRPFVSLLNVNAESVLNKDMPSEFETMEPSLFGRCSSHVTVKNFEKTEKELSNEELETTINYPFEFLKFSKKHGRPNILIEKSTEKKRCINSDPTAFLPENLIGKTSTRINISDTYQGEMECLVKSRHSIDGKPDHIVQVKISLELVSFEPCQEKMPLIKFFEETSLMFSDSMQENFII